MSDKKIINVVKRNGKREPYDVRKVKQSVAFACEGTDVNPLMLEARLDLFIRDGISSEEIQKNIIQHALQLASPEEPEWLMVAGHAFAMNEQHKWFAKGETFSQMVKRCLKQGLYVKDKNAFSDDKLAGAEELLDYSRDLKHSYSSLVTSKYKYQNDHELIQHMSMLNALRFCGVEKSGLELKSTYDVLSNREFSLATPFMSNLRNGGNTASCFIIAPEDSLESLMRTMTHAAQISKSGGGVGVFMGFVRAHGSEVNGRKSSAGSVVNWIKILNDIGVAVDQGGKRAGAIKVSLPSWHNDIDKFLEMQLEHGDPRSKAYDVFPNMICHDIFMERVENGGEWVTFCPHEVNQKLGLDVRGKYCEDFNELYLRVEQAAKEGKLEVFTIYPSARELMKRAMRAMFEAGLPDLTFIDEVNRRNPNKGDPLAIGILGPNLCVESFSNVVPDKFSHVCNLGSINMGNIRDLTHLGEVVRMAVRILNAGIELTAHPTETTKAHNDRYRTIGIGLMGVNDWLAKNYTNFYDTEEALKIAECVEWHAAHESALLAQKYGSFGAFEYSEWKNGNMVRYFKENTTGEYDWDEVQALIDKYGMCNSQLTSPAPTTSTSIYQDASPSFLPVFDAYYTEDNKTGVMPVAAKFLKMNPLGYALRQPEYEQTAVIDFTAALQKYTDTGLSMELIFDMNKPEFSAKTVYDTILHAWKKKLKTIYYIRSETVQPSVCVACSG